MSADERLHLARRVVADYLGAASGPFWNDPAGDVLAGLKDDIGLMVVTLAAIDAALTPMNPKPVEAVR